jgi:hypothetical protein
MRRSQRENGGAGKSGLAGARMTSHGGEWISHLIRLRPAGFGAIVLAAPKQKAHR